MTPLPTISGRGTRQNPENRYERIHIEPDLVDEDGAPLPTQPTQFYRDATRTALAENDSPDVGFRFSLNPYRGCEHGCIYCYARPTHEYLGFSAGLDFERRIMIKEDAPQLLRRTFVSPRWQPQVVALSGNTDCYQPIERRLHLTRRCLQVLCEFRNPVSIITKSALITRDIDLLAHLTRFHAVHVIVSLTTLDAALARRLEPRAAAPERRLAAIAALSAAGIAVGINIAPVVPGLNDSEIPAIVGSAATAGARSADWLLVRLPPPVDELFVDWLQQNFPERCRRLLGRIRECRAGRLSDARFGHRHRGEGPYAEHIAALFGAATRRAGLERPLPPLSAAAFERPGASAVAQQLQLC